MCSLLVVIECQSASEGMFKNTSRLKTKAPGLLPNVVCTLVLSACDVIERASSIKSLASVKFSTGLSLPCRRVRRILPIVWCILSHTEFAVGLYVDVTTLLILDISIFFWNSHPINSPPLPCTQHSGHGYWASQFWENLFDT